MGGVNTGGEDIHEVNGRPGFHIQYERIDGRGIKKTLPEMPPPVEKITDGGNCSYTFALAAAPGAVFELPVPGDEYILIANGNTAYCRMGGAGTVATVAVGGHDFPVGNGIHFRCRPGFTHIAYVAAAAAGNITFIHLREP